MGRGRSDGLAAETAFTYGIALILVIISLVYFRSFRSELPKFIASFAGILLLSLGWALFCARSGKRMINKNPLMIPILLFLSASALSLLNSDYPFFSLIALAILASHIFLFFLVTSVVNSEYLEEIFLKAVFLIILAASGYSFLQRFFPSDILLPFSERISSTFLNSDFFAAFIMMSLPLAIYSLFKKDAFNEMAGFALALSAILISVLGMLCTLSRSAALGVAVSLSFMAVIDRKCFCQQKAKLAILSLAVFALLIFSFTAGSSYCTYFGNGISESVEYRISETLTNLPGKQPGIYQDVSGLSQDINWSSQDIEGSSLYPSQMSVISYVQSIILGENLSFNKKTEAIIFILPIDPARKIYYSSAVLMIADHPLIGNGLGAFGLAVPDYSSDYMLYPEYYQPRKIHAHNEFLQVMAETGLFGIMAFLAIIIIFFRMMLVHILNLGNSGVLRGSAASLLKLQQRKSFMIAVSASILAILVQNIFSNSLRYPTTQYLFWVVLGIGVAAAMRFRKEGESATEDKRSPIRSIVQKGDVSRISAPVFVILSILSALVILVVMFLSFRAVESDLIASDAGDADDYWRAIMANPLNLDPYWGLMLEGYKRRDYALIYSTLDRLGAVIPGHLLVNYHHGKALMEQGRYSEARQEFLSVKNPVLRDYNVALSYYRENDPVSALLWTREAMREGMNNSHVHSLLAELLITSGDNAGARHEFEIALAKDESNVRAAYYLGALSLYEGNATGASGIFNHIILSFSYYDSLSDDQKEVLRNMIHLDSANNLSLGGNFPVYKELFEFEAGQRFSADISAAAKSFIR
ncbi:MAG TPA: O-antigen ligase family protein [Candidatus Nanoarchaeia archaeon]|nr:O-antigen ligase family protein [Candidatus Nanoarchaeia archaeon]